MNSEAHAFKCLINFFSRFLNQTKIINVNFSFIPSCLRITTKAISSSSCVQIFAFSIANSTESLIFPFFFLSALFYSVRLQFTMNFLSGKNQIFKVSTVYMKIPVFKANIYGSNYNGGENVRNLLSSHRTIYANSLFICVVWYVRSVWSAVEKQIYIAIFVGINH